MSKSFHLTAILFTVLTSCIAEATLKSKYSLAQKSNVDNSLICYMQTEDGKTLNLNDICGSSVRKTNTNSAIIRQLLETKQCPMCNLSNANLSGANLVGADLSNADLSNADLSNANMLGANLSNANISKAKLSRAVMPDGSIHN